MVQKIGFLYFSYFILNDIELFIVSFINNALLIYVLLSETKRKIVRLILGAFKIIKFNERVFCLSLFYLSRRSKVSLLFDLIV
jgi:hypothetical protein